jgi:hypothetical protein
MFINNLQLWLSSGLFSLINIDQETILDFLNIDRPFNNEDYSYLVGASTITTPVSFETSKLIIQSIWAHYQHGLGFVDIENIALFILFVRFIFLSKKYNIKILTSRGGFIVSQITEKSALFEAKFMTEKLVKSIFKDKIQVHIIRRKDSMHRVTYCTKIS